MNEEETLLIDACVRDLNTGSNGQFEPPQCVERRMAFTLSVLGENDDATLEAIFVGEQGKPLMMREVLRYDLNLTPVQAKKLPLAIYEGHYEINDHARSVRQTRLMGALNVEPCWEKVVRARFHVPFSTNRREP